jgi:hypothetical protein
MAVADGASARGLQMCGSEAAILSGRRYTGTKRAALESASLKVSASFEWMHMTRSARKLVICIDNSGYEVSLERRKIYVSIPDAGAEKLKQIRVIDESG